MQNFKVIFPGGYKIKDIANDNIDLNIVLMDGSVFFATFFTITNIKGLMQKDHLVCFWATDMLIIKDLGKNTIRSAIIEIIDRGYFQYCFSKIGTIEKVYLGKKIYDEIIDNLTS